MPIHPTEFHSHMYKNLLFNIGVNINIQVRLATPKSSRF